MWAGTFPSPYTAVRIKGQGMIFFSSSSTGPMPHCRVTVELLWFGPFGLRNVRVDSPSSPDLVGLRPRATPPCWADLRSGGGRPPPVTPLEAYDQHSPVKYHAISLVARVCCFSCHIAARLDNDTRVADGASRISRRPLSLSFGAHSVGTLGPLHSNGHWPLSRLLLTHCLPDGSIDKKIRAELGQVKERPRPRRNPALPSAGIVATAIVRAAS
ncbi:hypothetical protein M440DRAFT_1063060 [Trichoderma longibrachiatum ATCC 18648]|uniref:Uncharacterized protein n=1 Tax=Trichoderma longibrachiatum ATCC 18648 TaxID=983965 RepID=A0A2T4BVX4_TRILO|nr:hypothetical protein M440DRAFT_1063060 [Trichoderma longibrachiatum ATCC 18648]